VDLTATLYTPPGYDCGRDGPLPCLLWAYPREFKSKDAAGQLRQSPHQFSGIGYLLTICASMAATTCGTLIACVVLCAKRVLWHEQQPHRR